MADEVGWLQGHDGPEARLFQKIAEQGHYAGQIRPTPTRQGIYATAPNGKLLASNNTVDPHSMADMLQRALASWEALETKQRTVAKFPSGERRRRGEFRRPPGGLVLKVNSRDLPRAAAAEDWRGEAWNQDFAWFTKEEARQFLTTDDGAEAEVPTALVKRLARFHLVDNVRGQTWPPYSDGEVQRAELRSQVTATQGDLVSLRLEGASRCVATGKWSIAGSGDGHQPSPQQRGVQTRLLGHAQYDLQREVFVRFQLVAIGTRWGGTQYNGRSSDLQPSPVGFVFTLASDTAADTVAPAFWEVYPRW